ncbi:hypothetical protein H4S08_001931 [Coemansia sp. RSA 1365]|nr:hypothetical protein H4S08_001931 [Coemansia sp. RSA 1365]
MKAGHDSRRSVHVWLWCSLQRVVCCNKILGNVFEAENTIPGPDARAPKGSAAVRISPSVKCMAAGGEEGLQRDKREGTGDDLRRDRREQGTYIFPS